MNEKTKTLLFLAVAAVAVVVAIVSRPTLPVVPDENMRNKPLYPTFTDPLAVTNLEIIEFDEQRGEVLPFQVAQVDVKGKMRWSIPSHDDYPADAKDQVASVAAGLMGLTILSVASNNDGDQREYGVIDPDPKTLKVGETGVGTKVIMKDKDGNILLALILGKQVPDQQNLRYIRKVGESPIYVVEAKTAKLTTKFENWIERNLLGINTFDIKRLWIRDHSVDLLRSAIIQRGETMIEYNDTADPKWSLVEDKKFTANKDNPDEGKWVPVPLPEGEELNATKLDELKTALDDLKIVDISRKPSVMSSDLKASSDFSSQNEAVASLEQKGFYFAELAKGQVELFSNEGEIRIATKDGVEYVLRFGGIAGAGDAKKSAEENKDGDKDTKGPGMNRYLFVMAQFNPDLIPKPELISLPEAPQDAAKPAEEAKEGEKAPEAEKAQQDSREQIEKENKRRQEEYEQKIADGKKRVEELNTRFADWYYVISDEVYHKIHLGHDDLIRKKEDKPKEEPGNNMFMPPVSN